jgi:hypothetical protein
MSPPRALKLLSNSVIVERDVFTRAPTEPVTAHAVGHYPLVLLAHRVTPRIAMEPTRFRHSPKSSDIPRWPPCCPTQSPTSTRTSPPSYSTRLFLSAPSPCHPRGRLSTHRHPSIHPPHPRLRPNTPHQQSVASRETHWLITVFTRPPMRRPNLCRHAWPHQRVAFCGRHGSSDAAGSTPRGRKLAAPGSARTRCR